MTKVLVVDDEESLRDLLEFALQLEGMDVSTAANGRLGLDQIHQAVEAGAPFDVIVLDFAMPIMDGLRFLRSVRAEMPDPPPVVVFTAMRNPDILADLKAAGARAILAKPIELPDFVRAIREVLAESGRQ
jgi:CheY-like chemotaxis protein